MSWSFFQLRYKAAEQAIPVVVVKAQNTSRRCSACGYIDKKNRKSQSEFCCKQCGHSENADLNAAKNIALRATMPLTDFGDFRAAVNPPIAAAMSTARLQACIR